VAEKLTIGLAGVNEIHAALSYSRPHSSAATTPAIQKFVPHLTYSLDVTLSGFWLFAALKKRLRRIHFTCDKDVQASAGKWF
jgi:hypothetical protein